MTPATVTSKGQITISVDVRAKLGLHPGSRPSFIPTPTGGYEIHAEGGSIQDLKGALARPSDPVSLADMDDAIVAGATIVTFDRRAARSDGMRLLAH